MLLAKTAPDASMSIGKDFHNAITLLIREKGLKNIIESGSYLGLGTTKAICQAMTSGEMVFSIEANNGFHKQAMANNTGSGIRFLLGLSIPRPLLPVALDMDFPGHVYTDHESIHPYKKEIGHPKHDDLLRYALEAMDFKPDLVILDSAGHMGWQEFDYLVKLIPVSHQYYIALDDTVHRKHYKTLKFVRENPDRFTIEFETLQKFGSAIIKASGG